MLTAEKIVDLFAKNKNPITQKALLDLHLYIVDALQTDNFTDYLLTKTKAKVEFQPQVNKTPPKPSPCWDLVLGSSDFCPSILDSIY